MRFINPNDEEYDSDDASRLLYSYVEQVFGDKEDTICYYQNPLYFSQNRFRPSLVIVDKDLGIIVFKTYNYNENQLTQICDSQFGKGNWTIQDTKIRTNWYSFGQEFTCVQNGTQEYLNEIMKSREK